LKDRQEQSHRSIMVLSSLFGEYHRKDFNQHFDTAVTMVDSVWNIIQSTFQHGEIEEL
jgi:hypothetical protein